MNFTEIINRTKQVYGFKRDKELAELFGMEPNNFANRKKKGTLLNEIIAGIFNDHPEVNFHWLLTGEGQMKFSEETQINTGALGMIISGVEKALKKLKIKKPVPVKKAEFIAMCYEFHSQSDQEVSEEFIERHLRLVA